MVKIKRIFSSVQSLGSSTGFIILQKADAPCCSRMMNAEKNLICRNNVCSNVEIKQLSKGDEKDWMATSLTVCKDRKLDSNSCFWNITGSWYSKGVYMNLKAMLSAKTKLLVTQESLWNGNHALEIRVTMKKMIDLLCSQLEFKMKKRCF